MNRKKLFALIIGITSIVFSQIAVNAMQDTKEYPIRTAESVTWVHEEPYFTDKEVRNKIPIIRRNSSFHHYETLVELENSVDLIIKAEMLPESKNVIVSKDMTQGMTRNKVRILEVFKGELKEGDEIFISEPYFYMDNEDGELCAYTIANYAPSQVGNEYIFFLRWFDSYMLNDYHYAVSGFEKGRYLVKSDELYISSTANTRSNFSKEMTLTEQSKTKDGKSAVTETVPFTEDVVESISNEELNIGNYDPTYTGFYDFYYEVINKYVDR